MPPRVPTRIFAALPFSNGAVASSSSIPPPPPPSSPKRGRSLHTSSRDNSSRNFRSPVNDHQKRSFHSTRPSSASAKDPYTVLGVGKDASNGDIKKAYYAFAKKYHPDSNKEKGSKERFMEIQNAYDILSDDTKRQAYDKYGSASQQEGFDADAFARGGGGGFGGFQDFGGAFGGGGGAGRGPGSAGDLFESLFGGAFSAGGNNPFSAGGGRARPTRGDDLEASVTLTFLEACLGSKRKIKIQPVVDCKPCSGSGLKPGQKKSQCTTCRGSGQQTFQVQGMVMSSTCRACGGEGSSIPRGAKCGNCDGIGKIKEGKEVDVDIPAGIEDGMKVKLPGMGDTPISSSGPAGDLFVRINVRSSPEFRRQGTNLYHDAKVPLHVAMLGGKVRVPTLEGDVEVRVREGTQNGEEAVLKGRGVKSVYGSGRDRGDLVVGWKVLVPRSLSPFQKRIMQAYADDIDGKDPGVYFGKPPVEPELQSETAPPPQPESSTNGTTYSSNFTSSSSTSSDPEVPFVETESRPPPFSQNRNPNANSNSTSQSQSQSQNTQPRQEQKVTIPVGINTLFRLLPTIFGVLGWLFKTWFKVRGRR